jgi:hypothetical protein
MKSFTHLSSLTRTYWVAMAKAILTMWRNRTWRKFLQRTILGLETGTLNGRKKLQNSLGVGTVGSNTVQRRMPVIRNSFLSATLLKLKKPQSS